MTSPDETNFQTHNPQTIRAIKLAITLGVVLIAILIGGVGLVMWKIAGGSVKPIDHKTAPFTYNIEIPRAAKVLSSSLTGEKLAVTIEMEGEQTILILDLASGRILGRVEFMPLQKEPPAIIGG